MTRNSTLAPCCGCGGMFIDNGEFPIVHRYMESSPGCWAAYGEVLAREYSDPERNGYYRLTVDSYAVQHPGKPSRQSIQSVGVHLIRLCLLIELKLDMRHANDFVIAASAKKHAFDWLKPPTHMGAITVADLAKTQTNEHLRAMAWEWARQSWFAWSEHHAAIFKLLPDIPDSMKRNNP